MPNWKKLILSGSNANLNSLIVTSGVTGSLFGTASWSVSSSYTSTSSYVNTLNQTVTISGSLNHLGDYNHNGNVYHSGSKILNGVFIQTGSVLISGSTTQIGTNNLFGNTTLSGSITISGSVTSPPTPTIKVYGDMETNGVIKFMPVDKNIDTSITASYIYVSGSTKDLYFSQNGSGYSNITRLRWLEGNLYTGLLNGGLITQVNSNTYQISSGSGIIVNLNASYTDNPYPTVQYLNWGNLTKTIDALSGSYDQQFVSIDNTTSIFAQGTPYQDGQYNTLIPIGIVIHQNRSSINAVQTFPSVAYGWKQRSSDFVRAFGPLKISGYTLAASGSSTGSLVLSGGVSFVEGRNYTVDPNNPSYITEAVGITTSKIYRYRQSGSSWVYDTNAGAGYPVIDPTQYSNNGVLTPVGTNDWTIQRVFYFPNSATKAFYVYYGNATYSNQAAALAAVSTETFSEAPNTAANALYVGYMLLRHNADFTVPASYAFYTVGMFRGSAASATGGGGGGSTSLIGLTDTSIISPTNGQPLVYNSSTLKWQNSSTLTANLVGNASSATSASYATSASFATSALSSATAVTASYVNGGANITSATIGGSLYNTLTQNVGTSTTIYSFSTATTSYTSGFIDYYISDGANARSGQIQIAYLVSQVSHNETTTQDIGNTSGFRWDVAVSGVDVNLNAAITSGTWDVKLIIRLF